MKRLDFEKHLKLHGCKKLREGGNHSVWINEENKKQTAVPRHNEIVNFTCKLICKQLDIPLPSKY